MNRTAGRPRRRWWQHVLRVATVVAVAGAILYVTLPWWVPTSWLKGEIARRLSSEAGVRVEIDGLELDWSEGAVVEGMRIHSPAGFGRSILLDAEEVRLPLSPVRFLLGRRMAWMNWREVTVQVAFDEQGRSNLAPLARLKSMPLPRRVSLAGGVLWVYPSGPERAIRLNVSDIQYLAGRVESLGRVTLSADLDQQGAPAPVAVRLTAGRPDERAPASATFRFDNIDLAQLHLVELLGLPLRRLGGRLSGSLELTADAQAVVDEFGFELVARRLDAQPAEGPDLPVIDQAGLKITADWDPIADQLEVTSARLRLPGVDLAGSAAVGGVWHGQWEGLQRLQLAGTVHPDRLAGLVAGRPRLPGGFQWQGTVDVDLDMVHEGPALRCELTSDATGASIVRGEHVLKGQGVPLTLASLVEVDDRSWEMTIRRARLELGGNGVTLRGRTGDLRRVYERARQSEGPAWRVLLGALVGHLSVDVTDVPVLAALHPAGSELLADARLDGTVGAWIDLTPAERDGRVRIEVDPNALLTVGRWLHKPAGRRLTLEAEGIVPGMGGGHWPRVTGRLVGDDAAVVLRDMNVLVTDSQAGPVLSVTAEANARGLDRLLPLVPVLASSAEAVRGSVDLRGRLRVVGSAAEADAQVQLSDLAMVGGGLRIQPGQMGQAQLTWTSGLADDGRPSHELGLEADALGARWRATCRSAGKSLAELMDQPADADLSCELEADIDDVDALLAASDAVESVRSRLAVIGPVRLAARGRWSSAARGARMAVEATGSELTWKGAMTRRKAPGTRAGAEVLIGLRPVDDAVGPGPIGRPTMIDLAARAHLGASTVSLAGGGQVAIDPNRPIKGTWLSLRHNGEFRASTDLVFDEALLAAVGELERWARRWQLTGGIEASARARSAEGRVDLEAVVDAEGLGLRSAQEITLDVSDEDRISLGRVSKPAGLPLRLRLQCRPVPAGERIELERLRVELSDAWVELTGQLAGRREPGPFHGPAIPGATLQADRVELSVPDLSVLADVADGLAGVKLSGAVKAELVGGKDDSPAGDWSGGLEVRLDEASATLGGKRVRADGALSLTGRRWGDGPWRLDALKTDALSWQVGTSRGWLIGDVRDLTAGPKGRLHLLCTRLDDRELAVWMGAAEPSPPARIGAERRERIGKQAARWMSAAPDYLADSDLRMRVSVDRMTTYDPVVGESYPVDRLEARLACREGRVELELHGGFNGGLMRRRLAVDLAEPNARVQIERGLRDVIATPAIQPQLARYFPGNTVTGYFNRMEVSSAEPVEVLANTLDARYPLNVAGRARTVATDGYLVGPAGPDWLRKVFPRLNLTRYEYQRMTAFADLYDDGSAANDMIFLGDRYDLYMEGVTSPDQQASYEVGLVTLGQYPEWSHRWRQGRLPLMRVRGRIVDGELIDQKVSLLWPNETLFTVFLKNSLFYRMYLHRQPP